MSVKESKELHRIMKSELCSRCGTCVGLSLGKISFVNKEKKYFPEIIEPLNTDEAERILNACPGKEFSFPEYNNKIFPNASHFHNYIGSYEGLYIAYAKDEEVRRNAASGGILSSLLIHLLESKKIDGVITTRMSEEKPWLTEVFIAQNKDEILESAQSKYIITSVNEILAISPEFKGNLAYVGLPSQVQSIRKLQASNDVSVKNIKYIFGPFYGNTLYFSSVKSFLRSYGEKDYTKIKKLWFRYGEWPGNMRVEMQSGKTFELKKFHANYLIPFHIVKNSLYCTDLSNEFSDISGGDAWAPVYEDRGKGFSIVITRSKEGESIIREMEKSGILNISVLSEKEAIEMHSHGYDLKKRGSFIRMKFRKWTGRKIPDWGYTIGGFKFSRYLMEAVISFLFLLSGTRIAWWLVEQFSPDWIGRMFEKTRNRWKKSTSSIKRKDLG